MLRIFGELFLAAASAYATLVVILLMIEELHHQIDTLWG